MDGVFWFGEVGFVVDPQAMASRFPDGVRVEQTSLDALLVEGDRLPPLGAAPVASWLLARLMFLTNERLGFEANDTLHHDGGGYYLNFIAFSKQMQPLAFFNVHGTSAGCQLWGQCDRGWSAEQLLSTFRDALLEDPTALMSCRLQSYDTDPPDLDRRRVRKLQPLGWDGEHFLGTKPRSR
ncbi:hypothetical protein [Bremerella cremea]|uniref:hypothetical protein n=1 Tax=Bremerella cremea TaxID=1031537 RepID=UPI0031E76D39